MPHVRYGGELPDLAIKLVLTNGELPFVPMVREGTRFSRSFHHLEGNVMGYKLMWEGSKEVDINWFKSPLTVLPIERFSIDIVIELSA